MAERHLRLLLSLTDAIRDVLILTDKRIQKDAYRFTVSGQWARIYIQTDGAIDGVKMKFIKTI